MPEDGSPPRITPVNAAESPVLRAVWLVGATAGLAGWAAFHFVPAALFVALPAVIIGTIAIVFGTGLVRRGGVVLTIDEDGLFDRRKMAQAVPWHAIARVHEQPIYRKGVIVDTWFIAELKSGECITITATTLEYSKEGLRHTFAEARAAGLLG